MIGQIGTGKNMKRILKKNNRIYIIGYKQK